MIKKTCCSRFSLHKFVHLKFENLHLQGLCSLRPCISRPNCSPFDLLPKWSGQVIWTEIKSTLFVLHKWPINHLWKPDTRWWEITILIRILCSTTNQYNWLASFGVLNLLLCNAYINKSWLSLFILVGLYFGTGTSKNCSQNNIIIRGVARRGAEGARAPRNLADQ